MTCRQLRSYLDHLGGDVRELSPEAGRHVSNCAPCRELANTWNEAQASLRLLRESAPKVANSVDSAVLARYREHMTVPQPSTHSRWSYLLAHWRLAALTTAALVIFAGVLLVRKTSNPANAPAQPQHATEIAKNSMPDTNATSARPRKTTSRKSNAAIATHQVAIAPPIRHDDSQEFRSLMYCDELSCEGGMDVVRLELPSFPSGFLPGSTTPARRVSAEVLVGADGFARGIRIVQ